jgi:hypothetical protein
MRCVEEGAGVKICEQCGSIVNEPRFRLFIKIECFNGNASQMGHGFETLEEMNSAVAIALLERCKEEFEKIKR